MDNRQPYIVGFTGHLLNREYEQEKSLTTTGKAS